jgi:hypothetical protein
MDMDFSIECVFLVFMQRGATTNEMCQQPTTKKVMTNEMYLYRQDNHGNQSQRFLGMIVIQWERGWCSRRLQAMLLILCFPRLTLGGIQWWEACGVV